MGFLWASLPLAVPERRREAGLRLQGKIASHILPVFSCLWARILSWGESLLRALPQGKFECLPPRCPAEISEGEDEGGPVGRGGAT